jgi:hypothetical protein
MVRLTFRDNCKLFPKLGVFLIDYVFLSIDGVTTAMWTRVAEGATSRILRKQLMKSASIAHLSATLTDYVMIIN